MCLCACGGEIPPQYSRYSDDNYCTLKENEIKSYWVQCTVDSVLWGCKKKQLDMCTFWMTDFNGKLHNIIPAHLDHILIIFCEKKTVCKVFSSE